jgi:hypothetical protein
MHGPAAASSSSTAARRQVSTCPLSASTISRLVAASPICSWKGAMPIARSSMAGACIRPAAAAASGVLRQRHGRLRSPPGRGRTGSARSAGGRHLRLRRQPDQRLACPSVDHSADSGVATTARGCTRDSSGPPPPRPTRMTSAVPARRVAVSAVAMTDRPPALRWANSSGSSVPGRKGGMRRIADPAGGSSRITSEPYAPSSRAQYWPAMVSLSSMTRRQADGQSTKPLSFPAQNLRLPPGICQFADGPPDWRCDGNRAY